MAGDLLHGIKATATTLPTPPNSDKAAVDSKGGNKAAN
jgi:hypothetical protein